MMTKVWLFNEDGLAQMLQQAVATGAIAGGEQAAVVKFLNSDACAAHRQEYPVVPLAPAVGYPQTPEQVERELAAARPTP